MILDPDPFLWHAVIAFSFRNMIARGSIVHLDIHLVANEVHNRLELSITMHLSDLEPAKVIHPSNAVHSIVE